METEAAERLYEFAECHLVVRTKFALDDTKSNKSRIANPVYKNVSGYNHAQSISDVQRLSATFQRGEVWQDLHLLSRVFYRNWNQHKSTVYYRRLYELRRILRILDQQEIGALCERITSHFYAAGTSKNARRVHGWQQLPCAVYVRSVCVRLLGLVRLVQKVQRVAWNVYVQFTAQVAQTLFMPLAMVVQGISARAYVVMDGWNKDLCSLYEVLAQWLMFLPVCVDAMDGNTYGANNGRDAVDGLPPAESLFVREPFETSDNSLLLLERLTEDANNLSLQRMVDKRGVDGVVDMDVDAAIETKQKMRRKNKKKKNKLQYMDDEDIGGAEHAAVVSAIIEQAVARSYSPNSIDRTTTDVAVFNAHRLPCRQRSHMQHTKSCNCDKHRQKAQHHNRHHHRHHHHHKHKGGLGQTAYHQMVHGGQPQPDVAAISQGKLPAIDFAFTELACLGLSLLLSICLLLIGYKIGNIVCKYEVARDRSHGRGHKGSLARLQDKAPSKDASVQCDDAETDPLLPL
ncbi:hypothetical protein IWW50_001420 [Coemansia erecta]|nr:hypothetical protein IWW50_001420 [Coemansia erecta]